MSFERQILVIALMSLLAFFYVRGFILGIKNYQLNNSAYKKRKKGETIVEWFLYTRYRDIIPKGWIIFYFILLALHVLCFIISIVVNFTSQSKIGEIVLKDSEGNIVSSAGLLTKEKIEKLNFWDYLKKIINNRIFKK